MTQSQFEQELIRAIEHGCPECNMAPGFFDHYHDHEQKVDCGYCLATLWTPNGWIPELQEIVKGE